MADKVKDAPPDARRIHAELRKGASRTVAIALALKMSEDRTRRGLQVLKALGFAFMAGDRRFARWATTAKKAERAARQARAGKEA